MKIDDIFHDLRLCISLSKDTVLLDDLIYAASLSDDELDDKFYDYLTYFIDCFMFYVCSPAVDIKRKDRLIIQRFLIISVFRFKRGLVSIPDTKVDDLDWSGENEIN